MSLQMIILYFLITFFTITAFADVNVKGYYKKDGTYVQPHNRSNPDGNPNNNWSTKGNYNPHTGEEGTHNPNVNSLNN